MLPRIVGIYAWLLFAAAVALLVTGARGPKLRPEGTDAVRMPALAMEFVEDDDGLRRIIGRPDVDPVAAALRDQLLKQIRFDYVFIVLYSLLFLGIAAVLAQRGTTWALWVAGAAVLTAAGAAGFDVVENLRMTRVLESGSIAGVDVASAGFLKWLCSFLTLALLSFTFFGHGGWGTAAGAACLLVAAVGMAGLAVVRSGIHTTLPIEVAFGLMMFVLMPLVAFTLTFARGAFGRG